jgi:hypothetical protein
MHHTNPLLAQPYDYLLPYQDYQAMSMAHLLALLVHY